MVALGVSLRIVPVYHAAANEYVRRWHRHNRPTLGAIFCVGVADVGGNVCGVAIVGRPVGREMGYARIVTYTLPEEGGASLRGAGYRFDGEAGGPGAMWSTRPNRAAESIGDDLIGGKWRWVA